MKLTLFTKPWKMPLPLLAVRVREQGVDGVELPVRPGFQVEPATVSRALRPAVQLFADHGLTIDSIAGPTDEATISACAEAGVPLIRQCVAVPTHCTYLAYEDEVRRRFDALLPLLERYGVALGIQNESGRCVSNAMGIRHLIERYDRKHIGAILDPAHCALNGEVPELAVDIVWSHLLMVNLKNVYWRRVNGPEAAMAAYEPYWTSGNQGLCSWQRVVSSLVSRGYQRPICLTAEYSDASAVDRLITQDVAYVRSLFATVGV